MGLRILAAVLLSLMVFLQDRLWFGDGGIAEGVRLQEKIVVEEARNAELKARNDRSAHQVLELQNGHMAVDPHAREGLGLVKVGDYYPQFVETSVPVAP